MRKIATTFLFVTALATVGIAQELTAALTGYVPFGVNDLDGEVPVSAELRFTISISDRFALEPFVTAGPDRTGIQGGGPMGFYGVQIRQRLMGFPSAYVFTTYGVAGLYSRVGYEGPMMGHFGFGLKQRVSKHLAFRPEVQLVTYHVVPIGARFVAGLSVGAGR